MAPVKMCRCNDLKSLREQGVFETAKLNDVEPLAYLSDVPTRIVNGHPYTQIDDLLPWAYSAKPELKAVA